MLNYVKRMPSIFRCASSSVECRIRTIEKCLQNYRCHLNNFGFLSHSLVFSLFNTHKQKFKSYSAETCVIVDYMGKWIINWACWYMHCQRLLDAYFDRIPYIRFSVFLPVFSILFWSLSNSFVCREQRDFLIV